MTLTLSTDCYCRVNVEVKGKVGLQRLSALSDKLIWIKENLPGLLEDGAEPTREVLLQLIEGLLSRFDEELEQIEIKKSIGGKNRRNQHSAREDAITQTVSLEKSDFEGCGLEMPDLLDPQNFKYFSNWNGELRYVQNIKLKRFRRCDLEKSEDVMET